MHHRIVPAVLIVLLAAGLTGCLVTQSTYLKKEEEANHLAKSVADREQRNRELAAANEALKGENEKLLKEAEVRDERIRKQSEDIARQDSRQAEMVVELDRMKAQLAKKSAEETAPSKAQTAVAGKKGLRIKVLTGDGKMASAQKMAKRIRALGYRVEGVGKASSSDYPANMVYYARNCHKQGKALAAKLGKDTILKPLTWKSVFHLIVVTGG